MAPRLMRLRAEPAGVQPAEKPRLAVCQRCASHLEFWAGNDARHIPRFRALRDAAVALLRGQLVALRGFGETHLVADARQERAVIRLLEVTAWEQGPPPLMFPTIEQVVSYFDVPLAQRRQFARADGRGVMLPRKLFSRDLGVAAAVCAGDPRRYRVMVAATPLHKTLLRRLESPVVAIAEELLPVSVLQAVDGGEVCACDLADVTLALDCPALAEGGGAAPKARCARRQVE
jgi:hydrogenase maturation factor HypF (carbamoyltransferase family)